MLLVAAAGDGAARRVDAAPRGRGISSRSSPRAAVRQRRRARGRRRVSFSIEEGETFGLVGESGSGKTTTGRCILRLIEPTSGEVRFKGEDVLALLARAHAAGAPRHADRLPGSVLVAQPADARRARSSKSRSSSTASARRPSGGRASPSSSSWSASIPTQRSPLSARVQRRPAAAHRPRARARAQPVAHRRRRAGIGARRLGAGAGRQPAAWICRQRLELTYLFIAHDLRLVRHICNRVAVMYLGKIVEMGPTERLFEAPAHPYTRALLSAIPSRIPTRRASASCSIRRRSRATPGSGRSPPGTGRRREPLTPLASRPSPPVRRGCGWRDGRRRRCRARA